MATVKKLAPKEQFKQGPETKTENAQAPQPLTPEQIAEYRETKLKEMNEILPFMRVQKEYNELRLALTEQGVMLGELSTRDQEGRIALPGLQGVELFMKENEMLGYLAQLKAGMEQAIKEKAEHNSKLEEELAKATN